MKVIYFVPFSVFPLCFNEIQKQFHSSRFFDSLVPERVFPSVWKSLRNKKNNYSNSFEIAWLTVSLSVFLPQAKRIRSAFKFGMWTSPQGEQLYTVKLYKGRHEFLQLVPSKETPLKTFPLKGVNVQVRICMEKMHNYRKRSNISSDSNLFLKIQTAHSCPKDVWLAKFSSLLHPAFLPSSLSPGSLI